MRKLLNGDEEMKRQLKKIIALTMVAVVAFNCTRVEAKNRNEIKITKIQLTVGEKWNNLSYSKKMFVKIKTNKCISVKKVKSKIAGKRTLHIKAIAKGTAKITLKNKKKKLVFIINVKKSKKTTPKSPEPVMVTATVNATMGVPASSIPSVSTTPATTDQTQASGVPTQSTPSTNGTSVPTRTSVAPTNPGHVQESPVPSIEVTDTATAVASPTTVVSPSATAANQASVVSTTAVTSTAVTESSPIATATAVTGLADRSELKGNAFVVSNNILGMDLFQENEADTKALSPWSITSAFVMALEASDGNSKKEMKTLFGLQDANEETLNAWKEQCSDYYKQHYEIGNLESETSGVVKSDNPSPIPADSYKPKTATIRLTNSIWCNNKFSWDAECQRKYFGDLKNNYGVEQIVKNFGDANFVNEINTYVSEKTNQKLQNMFKQDDIDADINSILLNTLYIRADWRSDIFDSTAPDTFYGVNGEQEVSMMSSMDTQLRYLETEDGYQLVTLPLADGLEMNFMVAGDTQKVSATERFAAMSSVDKQYIFQQLRESGTELIKVQMPKFNLAPETFSLKESLKKIGLSEAMNPDQAEFPCLRGDNEDNYYIQDVLHKVKLEVGENGVTAAADTAILVNCTAIADPPEPKEVKINKPFVFTITDCDTGLNYFVGQVSDLQGE